MSGQAEPGDEAAGPSFDRELFLERMDSDLDLIKTLVDIFETDRPGLLETLEDALGGGDARGIERAAHTIKGAVAVFAADNAREQAQRIELLGREGSVSEARGRFGELAHEIARVERDLRALIGDLDRGA